MGCDCGKPKCDGHCGVSPAVLQINNPSECVLFHRVEVPASMGDSKTNPPKSGAYKNVLLYYEADQTSWLYSSDGIPQKLVNGLTNYEDAINLPQINGVTLLGNKSLDDLGITDAIDDAVAEEKAEREAADETLGDDIDAINDELLSRAVTFDTVADMKAATNLKNGYYARTLGFHTLNDGGGALYKISDTGTANEMDVIAVGSLRAQLILGDGANVLQLGAYGDYTNDDSIVLQYAIDNYNNVIFPNRNYLHNSSLSFTKSDQKIICDGALRYQGSGFAIIFRSGTDSNLYFRYINAPNGGGVLVEATSSCGRNRLDIVLINSKNETFKVTGQNSTSSWYLNGTRWNSISGYAINLEIPSDSAGVYYSRFLFENMALLAHANDTKGILLNNIGGTSIEVEFNHVNFENVKGIRTSGNVGYLTINECRITEIAATDWLEFNGYIPNTRICTSGRVEMGNIKFNNITGGEQVYIDGRARLNSYDYTGARIVRTANGVAPLIIPNGTGHTTYEADAATNTIGDDIVSTDVGFTPATQVRVTNDSATTELNVPNYIYNNINQLIVNVVSTTTAVTVKYGTRTLGQTLAAGKKYMLFNIGNFVWATEIA